MGDVLTLSDGTSLEIVIPAARTDGRVVEVLFTLPPGRRGPPSHVHPHVEEWEVLAGTLDARVAGERRTLGAGSSLSIPPGTAHTFRNSARQPVRVLDRHRPAGRFEQFVRAEMALSAQGLHRPSGLLRLAVLWHDYRDTQAPASRPARALVSAMAALGRRLGLAPG
jgi:mannose-6-phosphate isomerase-like protein (cupin superfamily)